ncbi:DUF1036 domain-containing protein [Bradyrhizobium sp. LHD-71]|nr:DUF1036 domain-containing protein [Bradyrhizobium sp. LHD-71]MDQ8727252.1 DUF1036 domain-containing protein [Bradyrhizobium sp. LHD-71]
MAAVVFITAGPDRAAADLKLCNRMSYVVEAAIGIDDKGATATRGWFRIDPAQCRVVAQGDISVDRLLLHARALAVYGASPVAQSGSDMLCISQANFVIAAARDCRSGQTPVAFAEVKPSQNDDGHMVAYLAEGAEYDDEQARLAAIQRLLVIAGYDAAPIDGVDGPKTQNALAKFLRDRNLAADATVAPTFFETMIAAVQMPSTHGLTWCNDTPHRVMAAIGADDGKAITTRGWYRIEPGKCLHPDIAGQPKRIFSFVEAVDPDGRGVRFSGKPLVWGGPTTLCTRDTKFETNEQGDCASRGFASTGFGEIGAGGGEGRTLRLKMP